MGMSAGARGWLTGKVCVSALNVAWRKLLQRQPTNPRHEVTPHYLRITLMRLWRYLNLCRGQPQIEPIRNAHLAWFGMLASVHSAQAARQLSFCVFACTSHYCRQASLFAHAPSYLVL